MPAPKPRRRRRSPRREHPRGIAAGVANAPIIFFETDAHGVITLSAGRALEKLGLSPGELNGRPALELAADTPEAAACLRRALAGEAFTETLPYGDLFFETTFSPRRDGRGRLLGVVGIAVDVTERHHMRQAIASCEERYRVIAEKTGQLIYDYDVRSGRISWSGPIAKVTGFSTEEFAGVDIRAWERAIHPDDRPQALTALDQAMRDGKPYDVAYRFRTRSGSYLWMEDHGIFLGGADGEPARMLGTMSDITARREAEEMLRVVQFSVDRASVPVLWIECGGRIRYANDAAARLLGYGLSELLALSLPDIDPWADAKSLAGNVALLRQVRHRVVQTEMVSQAGRRIPVEVSEDLFDCDGREFICAFINDVSERRRVEKERERMLAFEQAARADAEAANRAKDEFLAIVSHELRTPVTAILGWNWLLRSGQLNPAEQGQALETIERNMQLQRRIIEDLLDATTLTTRRLSLDVRRMNLGACLRSACDSLQALAAARRVRVVSDIPARIGVMGDNGRLRQVFWNLLHNAVKFSPDGAEVRVRLRLSGEAGALVTISDSGRGIPKEFQPRLFELFSQAEDSLTREHRGLGLGLAIVKHLVELHGGSVAAHSEGAGLGATLSVALPATALPEPAPSRAPEPAASARDESRSVLSGLHILVAEDDEDTRRMLEALLSRCGARVSAACDAQEVIAHLDAEHPDVLLCDIGMPQEDGYSLMRRVRARGSALGGSIPAAALTAHTRPEDRTRALLAGFQNYLPKPVDPAELVTVVRTLADLARPSTKGT